MKWKIVLLKENLLCLSSTYALRLYLNIPLPKSSFTLRKIPPLLAAGEKISLNSISVTKATNMFDIVDCF